MCCNRQRKAKCIDETIHLKGLFHKPKDTQCLELGPLGAVKFVHVLNMFCLN